jgi:hypothetical protein
LEVAIQEVKLFGPGSSVQRLKGVDLSKVAEKVHDFVLELRNHIGHLGGAEKKKAKSLCEFISKKLETFSDAQKSDADVKKAGQEILYRLSSFGAELKAGLRKRIEQS